ncbi:hypothetical protein SAMN05216338_104929 [Bradyrhizobium sp. Rc2d]|nr:hypothetical protein SAMN05216338_104929 [Bradyrhizobium sp. Rc2d]
MPVRVKKTRQNKNPEPDIYGYRNGPSTLYPKSCSQLAAESLLYWPAGFWGCHPDSVDSVTR